MKISHSLEVEIITADGEAVTGAQDMVTLIRRPIDGNTIGTAKIKKSELPIGLEFDLSMIARDALVLNNNIVIQLPPDFDDRFLDAIRLFASLGQAYTQGCLWHIDGRGHGLWWHRRHER